MRATTRAQLNVTNREQVFQNVASTAPKVVINAAAYTAVDKAESEKEKAFAVNRDGPTYLAEACSLHDVPLIHISTDYVFDGTKFEPHMEDDPTAPLGVYGESKLAGELAVRAGCDRHIILRTAWVHGVHGKNFVKTILRLGREGGQLRIVDDQHGNPTFARDLAEAVVAVAERIIDNTVPSGGFGTFHCVGGGATTWHQFARKIFEIGGSKGVKIPTVEAIVTAQYPTPAPRPLNSVLDCSKLEQVYGITLRPWEDALAEMLDENFGADISVYDA